MVSVINSGLLREQALSLIEFARGSILPSGGFGYLDSSGQVDPAKPRQAYIQSRMIQVFGLAHLLGFAESKELVDHGVNSLLDQFLDQEHGGFHNAINLDGSPIQAEKLAYDQVFVMLAATTAKSVGAPRADELFNLVDSVIDQYFWDDEYQMMRNSWNFEMTHPDPYRGINANMHAVEAFSAAYDLTGDPKFRDRAYAICYRTVEDFAKNNNWMLPEHFNEKWETDLNFNIDQPADPFRPYGVTIGHLFEWSRLILQLQLTMAGTNSDLSWITPGAIGLYETAKKLGWAADGTPGFVYTVDWSGKPVVRSRMHWVAAEAVMTAFTLWHFIGETEFLQDYENWWRYIEDHLIDKQYGSWFHELDPAQNVVAGTWSGKPDIYHAFNACLLPLYPMTSSFVNIAATGQ